MLAKLTSKNQLTLPKSVTDRLGPVQYFEVQLQAGQVLLTPVRIQRGDAVRAKLAELDLDDAALAEALSFAEPSAKPAKATQAASSTKKPVAKKAPSVVKAPAKPKAASKAVEKSVKKTEPKSDKSDKSTPVKTVKAVKPVKALKASSKSAAARRGE